MDKHYRHGALMRYANKLGFGQIHTKLDPETGLHAVIAIHSNELGSAIGGCRCYPYHSDSSALKDVLRLSYMMTLKAAVCDLPHGGAKSVIIQPKKSKTNKLISNHLVTLCIKWMGDISLLVMSAPHPMK